MDRDDLARLSKAELVEAYLALQARLQRPSKTSQTSSKPPSTDRKARREHARPGGAKPGHEGHSRLLHENPDRIVDHRSDVCPKCDGSLADDLVGDIAGEYDEIDVPAIAPFVVRHRRLCVSCPHCSSKVNAPLPDAAQGSPFGPRLHGLVLYLKTYHAVSFARLERMMADLFGVKISQGALANILKRSHGPFVARKKDIITDLREAEAVASDETGIRIEGLNGYHWVFMSKKAIVHEAQLSRAAQVVRDVMGDHRPRLWLSDGYSAQRGHGEHHQTCLAHLARDIAYAVEASDDMVPLRLKLWLDKVFVLARNMTDLAASTVRSKARALKQGLTDILAAMPDCEIAQTISAKMARASPRLLTFLDYPGEIDVTNNACERALRPAVIQRKVTNGFRSMWAAKGDCAVRTVVDTQKIAGHHPFQTITATLA